MDVDDAKIRDEAKAILKETMDPSPDPKKAQIEIWEAWFDQMADGSQPPEIAGETHAAVPFPLDLSPLKRYPGGYLSAENGSHSASDYGEILNCIGDSRQTGRARIPNQDHTPWPRVRMR